jgi:ATP-dependent Lhr-like helicase
VIPTNAAPITFYIRETAEWLPHALAHQSVDEKLLAAALSPEALQIRALLQQRGACFANDLQRITGRTRAETAHALWELATAGLAAADGFDQLRALMDPRRKATTTETPGKRPTRTTAGRWSLLDEEQPKAIDPIARARRTDTALESFARMLLARYGILFRDLLARESNAPKWRELLNILRRLEARGEVRGGRFVTGFGGEQFALPEAVESLREARKHESQHEIAVAAADPLNLVGVVVPGERVPAVPGREVRYRNGSLLPEVAKAPESAAANEANAQLASAVKKRRHIPLIPQALPVEPAPPAPTLF